MTSDTGSQGRTEFLDLARKLDLLKQADAEELLRRCTESGLPPEQEAERSGLLDASQIDIINTLQHPTETIPGYEILDLIGRGGMGVVYRARQLNLDREVALKTILFNRTTDAAVAGRFEREAQTVGRLRNPHIVAAYDFGRHDGRVYLAMELVDGEDAETLLSREGRLKESAAWSIARQTAAGLAHAASQGVVHRDIKPANLLLVDPPEGFPIPPGQPMVKVADFGLAFLANQPQIQTRFTTQATTVGSPHYMAAEQIADSAVDHRADVYALGATVYHLVSGHPPYANLSLSQIIAQKVSGQLRPLHEVCPTVSASTCRLVERMMAHAPEDRFATYAELIAAIDEIGQFESSAPRAAAPGMTPTVSLPVSDDIAATQTMPVAGAATATFSDDLEPAPIRPQGKRRALPVLGFVVTAMVAMMIFALEPWESPGPPRRVPMREAGWSTPLFLGTTTVGWRNISGNWIADRDADQGYVLSGTNGLIGRPLFVQPSEGGRRGAAEFYRLQLSVEPHQATAIGIHFAIASHERNNGRRAVVRLTSDSVAAGFQNGDGKTFEQTQPPQPLPRPWNSRHLVIIERLPTGWFITVDGEPIDAVAFDGDGEIPEIRLSVEEGPAWFSDVFLEVLRPLEPEENDAVTATK